MPTPCNENHLQQLDLINNFSYNLRLHTKTYEQGEIKMDMFSPLLGDILVGMEVISTDQLDEALQVQQVITENNTHPGFMNNQELIAGASYDKKSVPLLGEILMEKGFLTTAQLEPALDVQTRRAMKLSSLDSTKLATALELGFIINSTIHLPEVLTLIMKYANIVTGSTASTLMLKDEKTGELVFSIPTGPKADRLKDIRIPQGAGIAGWVAQNEQYLVVNDAKEDSRFYSDIDAMTGSETKSLLCVPMKSKNRLIGVLEVLNKEDNGLFLEDDALLLSIFAHQAAIAIENASLFSSLKEKYKKEQAMKKELEESERLKAIGTIAGGIAHEFNNILSIIMGNAVLSLLRAHDLDT